MKIRPIITLALTLICCSVSFSALAKTGKTGDKYIGNIMALTDSIWRMDLPGFDSVAIPEDYSKYPAVIISSYKQIDADRKGGISGQKAAITAVSLLGAFVGVVPTSFDVLKNELRITELDVSRVKVNSREGVEKFNTVDLSSLHYESSEEIDNDKSDHITGIRIIKPDGTVLNYSLIDLLAMRDEYTQTAFIEALEPGDCIDIFDHVTHKIGSGGVFSANIQLRNTHPMLNHNVRAYFDNSLAVVSKPFNGAGELKKQDVDENTYMLELSQQDVDASPAVCFDPSVQTPVVKIRMSSPGFNQRSKIFGKKGYNLVTDPEVFVSSALPTKHGSYFVSPSVNGVGAGFVTSERYKYPVSIYLTGDIAEEVKDLMKKNQMTDMEAADYLWTVVSACQTFSIVKNEEIAYNTFCNYLNKVGLKNFKLGLTTPWPYEPIDDVVSLDAIRYFVYFPDFDKYYFFNMFPCVAGEITPIFRGRKAYVFNGKIGKNGAYSNVKTAMDNAELIELPEMTREEMIEKVSMEVNLDETMTGFYVDMSITEHGVSSLNLLLCEEKDYANCYNRYFQNRSGKVHLTRDVMKKIREDDSKSDSTKMVHLVEHLLSEDIGKTVILDSLQNRRLGFDTEDRTSESAFKFYVSGLVNLDVVSDSKRLDVALPQIMIPKLNKIDSTRTDAVVLLNEPVFIKNAVLYIPETMSVDETSLRDLNISFSNDYVRFISEAVQTEGAVSLNIELEYLKKEIPVEGIRDLIYAEEVVNVFKDRKIVLVSK